MAEPVNVPFPRPEPREPDLQGQVDDLRLALRDWRRNREYSESTQKRLEQITLQCAQLVETWQQMQKRLGERGAATQRLLPGTGERIRALERAIENEWEAIPTGPDDPARQVAGQMANLVESCVTATNLALRGFENAENRVAALEREIQTGLAQVSHDLQQVLTEIRAGRQALPAAAPFPLEGVMRIHQELRESGAEAATPSADSAEPVHDVQPAVAATTALESRVETLERTVEHVAETTASVEKRRPWGLIGATIAIGTVALVLFGLWMQRRVDARLNEAAAQVAAAERQRDAEVASTREQASQQVAAAQRTATQAQVVGTVMAAPDLVRYWLTGLGESRAYAHVLISRSRGVVFSASLLQAPGSGKTYQLWLLTRGGPVSAGVLTPDGQGRVTLVSESALILPGRLTGALVTREPNGGSVAPSTDRVLIQVE